MARRKDPAAEVVDFFTNAPLGTAQTVLAIAKSIVGKRAPKTSTRKPATSQQTAAGQP